MLVKDGKDIINPLNNALKTPFLILKISMIRQIANVIKTMLIIPYIQGIEKSGNNADVNANPQRPEDTVSPLPNK